MCPSVLTKQKTAFDKGMRFHNGQEGSAQHWAGPDQTMQQWRRRMGMGMGMGMHPTAIHYKPSIFSPVRLHSSIDPPLCHRCVCLNRERPTNKSFRESAFLIVSRIVHHPFFFLSFPCLDRSFPLSLSLLTGAMTNKPATAVSTEQQQYHVRISASLSLSSSSFFFLLKYHAHS